MSKNHPVLAKTLRVCAALAVIAAAIVTDSAYRLAVTEYSLEYENLPSELRGLRIVQLSDLHGMSFGEGNRRLIEKVSALEPDIIVLTGDYIEGTDDIEVVKTLCAALVKIAPVYFCSGNHDWGSGKISDLAAALEECGVRYLRNEYETVTLGDAQLVIAGVEDPNSWAEMTTPDELAQSIAENAPNAFVILLGHRNYWCEEYPDLPVDLIFSGHGHGGVIRLPGGVGVLGTEHNFFPEYDCGVFKSGRYNMVVSRGLGGNGVLLVPRFLNNPEIVCVTLE
jgi:hypothetical protein